MTVTIVDLLEVVQVEEDERERARYGRFACLVQLVEQRAPVQEPGERIVVGEEARLGELGRDR